LQHDGSLTGKEVATDQGNAVGAVDGGSRTAVTMKRATDERNVARAVGSEPAPLAGEVRPSKTSAEEIGMRRAVARLSVGLRGVASIRVDYALPAVDVGVMGLVAT
jgi:hypothetical protein